MLSTKNCLLFDCWGANIFANTVGFQVVFFLFFFPARKDLILAETITHVRHISYVLLLRRCQSFKSLIYTVPIYNTHFQFNYSLYGWHLVHVNRRERLEALRHPSCCVVMFLTGIKMSRCHAHFVIKCIAGACPDCFFHLSDLMSA